MHKRHNKRKRVESAIRARSKIRSGQHMVVPSDDLEVGARTKQEGTEYRSLTQARKAAKHGEAIVRKADGIVVSVK